MSSESTYNVEMNGKPMVLRVTLSTEYPTSVYFAGHDVYHKNTFYFSRRKSINGHAVLEFPLPLSPKILKLIVKSESGAPVQVKNVTVTPLKGKSFYIDEYSRRFIEFITTFAQEAGYLPNGNYMSPDENFVIVYKDEIDGVTPARVNRQTGLMKASSNQMKKFTIPMRMFIMLHEFCHHCYPNGKSCRETTIENEADSCALWYYLRLGFPQTEANYAMTKVFQPNPETNGRVENLHKIIMEYDYAQRVGN